MTHVLTEDRVTGRLAPVIFTLTIFTSASLLFFVQPLFAKIALPAIGGAPAVWTTAMLFFQTVLLLGYLYAHVLTRLVPPRAQVAVHLGLWALGLTVLPLGLPAGWDWAPGASAAWATLTLLAMGVGLPFAALSANAPLLQSWYARSGGPSADDPYFLYGASNLGSFAALLGFPLVAEPLFGGSAISAGFSAVYLVLGAGLLASGVLAGRGAAARPARAVPAAPIGAARIAGWVVLAFVPSSLMLAVTTKISTDMGAIPLIWVVPLALYLLSFVVTFRARPLVSPGTLRAAHLVALAGLAALFLGAFGAHPRPWVLAGALIAFFAVALFAHARLYAARPAAGQLTLFYLAMSLGGALGGAFNSLAAPILFDGLAEGPVTLLAAAALVLSPAAWRTGRTRLALAVAAALGAAILLRLAAPHLPEAALAPLVLAPLAAILVANRAALGAGLAGAVVYAAIALPVLPDEALFRDRSFFGTHHVDAAEGRHRYTNGTTLHGAQDWPPAGRPAPLTYYHADGPLAQSVRAAGAGARIGIVGLGVGALACHAQTGQDWTFYEIDPVVDRIARDPLLFTFLSDCTPDAPTIMGDARVRLAAQDTRFDLLVIDAFSSDAVPVHLTTREAMALYLDRLAPGGRLVYHISNRYYDIARPLGRAAADLGLAARVRRHAPDAAAERAGASPSEVAVFAPRPADLGPLGDDPRWQPLGDDGGPVWTDDYANLLGVLRWR